MAQLEIAMAERPIHISEQVAFTTVRLEGRNGAGETITGTGYLFRFEADADRWVPAIITNRHVVQDLSLLEFHISLAGEDGSPLIGSYHTVRVSDAVAGVIGHPSPEIDLCAIPIGGLFQSLNAKGLIAYAKFWRTSDLLSDEEEQDLGALEPILMIGYPNGLWDSKNNRPLLRRGVTSTHPAIDLNGKGEFLIDAACFPGSSGSPVILYREGGHMDRRGNIVMGGVTPKLLGTLYAGPQVSVEGEVRIVPVPTAVRPIVTSSFPLNLGLVIKARYVRDLAAPVIERAIAT